MEVTNQEESNKTPTVLLHSKLEAAAMLNVSPRTIDNLIAMKELPVRRIRRRVLIPHAVLVNFAKPSYRKAA